MSAFAFSDHPIEDLIRKNLNTSCVFVRAARNQRRSTGAAVAAAHAREGYARALELVRALPDDDREHWSTELVALQAMLETIESDQMV